MSFALILLFHFPIIKEKVKDFKTNQFWAKKFLIPIHPPFGVP